MVEDVKKTGGRQSNLLSVFFSSFSIFDFCWRESWKCGERKLGLQTGRASLRLLAGSGGDLPSNERQTGEFKRNKTMIQKVVPSRNRSLYPVFTVLFRSWGLFFKQKPFLYPVLPFSSGLGQIFSKQKPFLYPVLPFSSGL